MATAGRRVASEGEADPKTETKRDTDGETEPTPPFIQDLHPERQLTTHYAQLSAALLLPQLCGSQPAHSPWPAHFLPLDPSVPTSNAICLAAYGGAACRP
eukprot:5588992-Pyramimonas_sp.AAC.1